MPVFQCENFFPDTVRTEKEALSFLKKLTAVSVSTILYNRGMFPEDDYAIRQHGNVELHILEKHAVTPSAKRIVELVRSTFVAIEKKILTAIVIGITDDPDNPDDFQESYSIKMKYSEPLSHGIESATGSGLAEQALQLIRELKQVTTQVREVNKQLYFMMRLLYCEETDTEFEPKGFTTRTVSSFALNGASQSTRCGSIRTPFTGFQMTAEKDVRVCFQ